MRYLKIIILSLLSNDICFANPIEFFNGFGGNVVDGSTRAIQIDNNYHLIYWEDERNGAGNPQTYGSIGSNTQEYEMNKRLSNYTEGQKNPQIVKVAEDIFLLGYINNSNEVYYQLLNSNFDPTLEASPVNSNGNEQSDHILYSDGSGFAYYGYSESSGIFIQKFDSAGSDLWSQAEPRISNDGDDLLQGIYMVSDGSIIIIHDRLQYPDYEVKVTKFDADGNAVSSWDNQLISEEDTKSYFEDAILTNDGVFVIWRDHSNKLYGKHILFDSTDPTGFETINVLDTGDLNSNTVSTDYMYGTNEILTCWNESPGELYRVNCTSIDLNNSTIISNMLIYDDPLNSQRNPKVETTGSDTYVVSWEDERNGTYQDLYIQEIPPSDDIDPGGFLLCGADFNQYNRGILSFENVYLSYWEDDRSSGKEFVTNIFARRNNQNNWDEHSISVRQGYHVEWYRGGDISSDGNMFIVWSDTRSSARDVYAQKVNSEQVLWDEDGVLIVEGDGRQEDPIIISDDNGGAYISWRSYENDPFYGEIYAQHINSAGNLSWPDKLISEAIKIKILSQQNMCSDQEGGVYVTWYADSADDGNYYGVHLTSDGTVSGPQIIIDTQQNFGNVSLESAGNGDAVIAWKEGDWDKEDIYAQRISVSNGNLVLSQDWNNGSPLEVCTASGAQTSPKVTYYSDDYVVVTWEDRRSEYSAVGANFIDSDGELKFGPENDVLHPTTANSVLLPRVKATSEGAFVVWLSDDDIHYTQKLTPDNINAWDSPVSLEIVGAQNEARLSADGSGGVYITFENGDDNESIAIAYISNNGNILFNEILSDQNSEQYYPLVRANENNGAYVVWADGASNYNGISTLGLNYEYIVKGCSEPAACNYNPQSDIIDDGSCFYTDGICETCENQEIIDNDADNDTICDEDDISGCMIDTACNYNDNAIDDDGSCFYTDGICETCDNNEIIDNDEDDDGVCDNVDACEGFDDNIDDDADGVADGCDVCSDFDDSIDTDTDSIPDDCDTCPNDADNDEDDDGVCGNVDTCEGFDDNIDDDADGVADGCDDCTNTPVTEVVDANGCSQSQLSLYNGLIPEEFSIHKIYPNPFNPVANVVYGVPNNGKVEVVVYDISGKQISTLVNKFQLAGFHSVTWDAQHYPSGIYFVKIVIGKVIQVQKLILIK